MSGLLDMCNHPIWNFCATVSDIINGGLKVVLIKQPPQEIIMDWKQKYGKLPYE